MRVLCKVMVMELENKDSQWKNTEEGVPIEVWRLDGQDNLVGRILKEPSIYSCLLHTRSVKNPSFEFEWSYECGGTPLRELQFSSVTQLCPTLCDPMNRSTPGLPVHHKLPDSTETHVHRVGDAIQPSHPPSSPSLLPQFPPRIRVFSNESTLCMRWPKYWSFSFSISPSNEHPGLIPFRMDWLDLLAVQGTLKSLLQHHSSKASILQCSAFFTVQLSHPYMTTGKTRALTRWTLLSK